MQIVMASVTLAMSNREVSVRIALQPFESVIRRTSETLNALGHDVKRAWEARNLKLETTKRVTSG